MKKSIITSVSTTGGIFYLFGMTFKILHWVGANILILGGTFTIGIAALFFIIKTLQEEKE